MDQSSREAINNIKLQIKTDLNALKELHERDL
jgi:hypothetical protein